MAEPELALRVRGAPDDLDGLVVLRYHFVPCLRSDPPARLVPVRLADDPVPFVGMEPIKGEVVLRMGFPP